jgi:DNA-binding MurR/RpiR family transcriptional regulator
MDTLLTRIQDTYTNFGRGEKKIAEWILANPSELISLSISEMAANCGCGDATVIRFA